MIVYVLTQNQYPLFVFEGKLETKAYPRSNGNDYVYNKDLPIIRYTSDTITVNVNGGKGAISHAVPHTFMVLLQRVLKLIMD